MTILTPDFQVFSKIYRSKKPQLVWTRYGADLETPVSAMLKLKDESIFHVLFESVEGGESKARYSILAFKPDLVWKVEEGIAYRNIEFDIKPDGFVASRKPALDDLRDLIQESNFKIPEGIPPMAAGLFGYMTYDMVRYMEKLPNKNPDSIGIPEALYMRPSLVIIFDSVKDEALIVTSVWPKQDVDAEAAYKAAEDRLNWVVESLLSNPVKRSLYARYYASEMEELPSKNFRSHTPQARYEKMVSSAQEYIRAGDIFQVVPSRRVSAPFALPPFSFYRALRHLNPSPYMFYLGLGDFTLIGSSPEILVKLEGNTVTIRPIAGTRPRGKTNEEDKAFEKELLADAKECAEHLMLLDLGRNDVGRVSAPGKVKVTEQMMVERYSHVMHLVSNVEGVLQKNLDALDALIAGFPAGTVSGAPKIRAMEIIDELESERRSFYAGTVGYFSASGEMDSCIALRTALIKNNTLYLQAGGGVVADSDPTAEFIETENKLKALVRAADEAKKFI